jgi:hypothetical protein
MPDGPVRPCTQVGQSGNNVQLPTPIPNNVVVTLMGFTQTSATMTVQVLNSSTQAVVASISGTGISPTAMKASNGQPIATFNSGTASYFIKVTSNSGQTAQVILSYATLAYGATAYEGSYVLIAEDSPNGGDCDFNDCAAFLTWNLFSG